MARSKSGVSAKLSVPNSSSVKRCASVPVRLSQAAPLDPEGPHVWGNVSGRRSRQLLRHQEHTAAVHGFIAALAQQARDLGWEVSQLDPPHRASRYFRYDDRLYSVHPDAFGILRGGDTAWPFFLEWERRAVRPVTMAARLAPYLRYYASRRPTDDHGAQPAVLVVFDDDLAASHFLRVAREQMERTGVKVPLRVSHRFLVASKGPLGRVWLGPASGDLVLPGPKALFGPVATDRQPRRRHLEKHVPQLDHGR